MQVENGAYQFSLPVSFFPDYQSHKITGDSRLVYDFELMAEIISTKQILFVSSPEGSSLSKTDTGVKISIEKTQQLKNEHVRISYKTDDDRPELRFEVSQDKSEVALMASFGPTFEIVSNPQELVQTIDGEAEENDIQNGSEFMYTFILDKSGSMSGGPIETAKAALKLFIRSLPVGSQFFIISFGDRWNYTKDGDQFIWDYNDESMDKILKLIS